MVNSARLRAAYQTALDALLKERHPDGYWVGELSTSALSTATAVMALDLVQKAHGDTRYQALIDGGLAWLEKNQNDDGAWGDTVKSFSNISTTMLCRAAIHLTQSAPRFALALSRAENWLFTRYGSTPEELAEAVRARYGKDRTFATPILTTCALAGLVSWKEVPPLPFELSVFPQSWFRFFKLQVVSYALPALIAIGRCIYYHKKPWNPFSLVFRWLARSRSMKVLEKIQPPNGGFLEATPLTSFVTLSLAACGLAHHPVAVLGASFIENSVRPDGSWPIDTNLSTWVTTLAVNALDAAGMSDHLDRRQELFNWLIAQQYGQSHPYTGAAPWGWAWTPLPGGVPDADDTPGAIIAAAKLLDETTSVDFLVADFARKGFTPSPEMREHLLHLPLFFGLQWLRGLQNRDGGWPTFCRGWGHLPFDRSGCDLTAHVIRAIVTVRRLFPEFATDEQLAKQNLDCGLAYLTRTQRPDGSWLPLWFGCQHAPDDENPTYGTARVLAAYRDMSMMESVPAKRGIAFLLAIQNEDGGWGGAMECPSSIEETALSLEVLLDAGPSCEGAVNKGLDWLVQQVESGGLAHPTPIGFYFAKLWYFEKLYPIIFSVAALGRACQIRAACLP